MTYSTTDLDIAVGISLTTDYSLELKKVNDDQVDIVFPDMSQEEGEQFELDWINGKVEADVSRAFYTRQQLLNRIKDKKKYGGDSLAGSF